MRQDVITIAKDVLVLVLVVPAVQVVQDVALVARLLVLEAVLDALVVVPAVPPLVKVDALVAQDVALVAHLLARADALVVRDVDQDALQHAQGDVRADALDVQVVVLAALAALVHAQVVLVAVVEIVTLDVLIVRKLEIIT